MSSELGKLLENSYRALNIAFMHEWTLLAEKIGVNLFDVVDSIRVRRGTHDNMRYPGFGVGGYCLTKDSLLAQWSAANLFGIDTVLEMTLAGLKTNYEMPLHTLQLVEEAAGGSLVGKTIAVCGVSYLAEVADTRNSPTETLLEGLLEKGARPRLHDPHVVTWIERPIPTSPRISAKHSKVQTAWSSPFRTTSTSTSPRRIFSPTWVEKVRRRRSGHPHGREGSAPT